MEMKKKFIGVACHNPDVGGGVLSECYNTVVAGAEGKVLKQNYMRDDIGDNISNKNPIYCEMTVMYWVWKNVQADVKGLCHYRRFLAHHQYGDTQEIITGEEIESILHSYNLILPKPIYKTHKRNYAHWYKFERELNNDVIYCMMRKSVITVCPEYADDLKEVFLDDYMIYSNIIIAKEDIFNSYSQWVFLLLNEIEKNYRLYMGAIPDREIGYISEYLINVWIKHNANRLKIHYLPIMKIDNKDDAKHKILALIERIGMMGLIQRIMVEMHV